MLKRILDTSVLVKHWRLRRGEASGTVTPADVGTWARELISAWGTDAIVTPVQVEFVAGTTSARELQLARAFIEEFQVVDGGKVLNIDWQETLRIASRVPRDGRRRQLGDCLIRAIAKRLNHDVRSHDQGFPR